jgi:hypothetical protein
MFIMLGKVLFRLRNWIGYQIQKYISNLPKD